MMYRTVIVTAYCAIPPPFASHVVTRRPHLVCHGREWRSTPGYHTLGKAAQVSGERTGPNPTTTTTTTKNMVSLSALMMTIDIYIYVQSTIDMKVQ